MQYNTFELMSYNTLLLENDSTNDYLPVDFDDALKSHFYVNNTSTLATLVSIIFDINYNTGLQAMKHVVTRIYSYVECCNAISKSILLIRNSLN